MAGDGPHPHPHPNQVMGHKLIDQYIRDEYRTSVKAVLDAALQGQVTDDPCAHDAP